MDTENHLSATERELANELAYLVAHKMQAALGGTMTDGEIFNLAQSNYEVGCSALVSLGIYETGQHATRFRIPVSVSDVPSHVAALELITRPVFDELLSAFIENYISYGGGLKGYRRVFAVPQGLENVAKLLTACKFATMVDGEFCWAEKISPVMQMWHIWDEDGSCREERRQIETTISANAFIETLPFTLKRKLRRTLRTKGELAAVEDMQRHWNGGNWTYFSRGKKTGIKHNDFPKGGMVTLKRAFAILRE